VLLPRGSRVNGLTSPRVQAQGAGLAVAPLAVLLDPLGDGHPQVVMHLDWIKVYRRPS
jgi:hypothetical protein